MHSQLVSIFVFASDRFNFKLQTTVSFLLTGSLLYLEQLGCGVSELDLKSLGTRYFTSKCHSLEDLNVISSLGWRGEAISSIAALSTVEIVTRQKTSPYGYCKVNFLNHFLSFL